MNVAIISQGPSAALWTGERDSYAAVIGVNAIPTRHACDWWVFVDYGAFFKSHPDGGRWCDKVIGHPKISTRPGNRERIAREQPGLLVDAFQWALLPTRTIPTLPTGGAPWQRQGGLAALGLAWSLRPQRVDTFGVDMNGSADALGCECAHSNARSGIRWERERFTWAAMVERMNAEGIAVRRALDGGGFADWSPENPTSIVGITNWQYDNGYGWTTTAFPAAGERDFRKRLARMIGQGKAKAAPVRQVA